MLFALQLAPLGAPPAPASSADAAGDAGAQPAQMRLLGPRPLAPLAPLVPLVPQATPAPTPTAAPTPGPEPVDECERMHWLLKYKSDGMSAEQIAEFAKMASALCSVATTPCAADEPTTVLFSDPRDVCNLCNGALEPTIEPTPAFSACLSTINWACCPESDKEVRDAYAFCPKVPADGWKAATMSANDRAEVKSWWSASCTGHVGLPASLMSAYTAAVPVLGVDEAEKALRQLKPAQSTRNLRLLGMPPVPVPPLHDHRAELAASMRALAAARSCDAALQSRARLLVDTVLCEHGQRC